MNGTIRPDQDSVTTLSQVIDRLSRANDAYRRGHPIMSDAAYDMIEDELRRLASETSSEEDKAKAQAFLAQVGAPGSSGWTKTAHPSLSPMSSLDKVQNEAEFTRWCDKLPKKDGLPPMLFVSEKMDGMSILLTYRNGRLSQAVTSGDGLIGENITRNVLVMNGVPHDILYEGTVFIRGEVVVHKDDFEVFFPGDSHPRNTAAGSSKRHSDWREACQHLTVYVYNAIAEIPEHQPESRTEEFEHLKEWGFNVPASFSLKKWGLNVRDSLPKQRKLIEDLRQDYIDGTRDLCIYEIDGLVIEIDDTKTRLSLGRSGLNPKGAVAYKFPHEESSTVLRDVMWQVGNSGRITPVAVFDMAVVGGREISRANLHNWAYMNSMALRAGQKSLFRGDKILISVRNDIIPQVEEVLGTNVFDDGQDLHPFNPPDGCPSCGGSLCFEGEYLTCPSDDCPAQKTGDIRRWVRKLGILHLGRKLVDALCEAGMVHTIPDLYQLRSRQAEIENLMLEGRRVGRAAQRALDELDRKREITLDLFVGSLGIPLIGRKMILLLVQNGFDDLDKMSKASVSQLAAVPGFGQNKAVAFRKGFDGRKDLISSILESGVSIVQAEDPEILGDSMSGQAVCFTGVRDKEAEAAIVAQGGTVVKGVSKNTTLLVCKDVGSSSSKAKKARTLGIEIIDRDTIRSRVGLRVS